LELRLKKIVTSEKSQDNQQKKSKARQPLHKPKVKRDQKN
jgi:hypothetical protein